MHASRILLHFHVRPHISTTPCITSWGFTFFSSLPIWLQLFDSYQRIGCYYSPPTVMFSHVKALVIPGDLVGMPLTMKLGYYISSSNCWSWRTKERTNALHSRELLVTLSYTTSVDVNQSPTSTHDLYNGATIEAPVARTRTSTSVRAGLGFSPKSPLALI